MLSGHTRHKTQLLDYTDADNKGILTKPTLKSNDVAVSARPKMTFCPRQEALENLPGREPTCIYEDQDIASYRLGGYPKDK